MTTQAPPRLVELARAFQHAKRDEDAAKKLRVEAERAILALLDFKKPEGQETYEAETPGGSTAKVIVKQPISSSFDGDKWPAVRSDCSAKARKAVKVEYKLDTKVARAIEEDEDERTSWLRIASLISRKPGKIAVDLKALLIEEGDALEDLATEFPAGDEPTASDLEAADGADVVGGPGLEGVEG
jgi:hypothetical protein